MMLTYDNLLKNAINDLPEFASEYNRFLTRGTLDKSTGNHIIFSFAFTPMLVEAIKNGKKGTVKTMMGFVENMSNSRDTKVLEVCDQSILEALNDEFDEQDIIDMMGTKTKEGFYAVKEYMM